MATVGLAVSIVTTCGADAVLMFPARSEALAVKLWLPSARGPVAVTLFQLPPLLVVPVPTVFAPSKIVIVTLASALPENNRLVFRFVMLSVFEIPLSLAAAKFGDEGTAGAAVSIVMLSAPDIAETFPATSVCLAVML